MEPTSVRVSSSTSKPTYVTHVKTTTTTYPISTRTCDGAIYPQACFHYSSVAQSSTYSLATCSNKDKSDAYRPLTNVWSTGHKNTVWKDFIAKSYINPNGKRKNTNCQLDEWPPNHFQQGRRDGWIRLLPGDQNRPVANVKDGGWKGFCKFPPAKQVKTEGGPITDMGSYYTMTSYTSTIITLNVMSYTWKNVIPPKNDPYGLTANVCRPSVLTADVGYALETQDWWYTNRGITQSDYNSDPGAKTRGVVKPTYKKRDNEPDETFVLVEGGIAVDEGNSTRMATAEELQSLGFRRCEEPSCQAELEMLREQQADFGMATQFSTKTASAAIPTSVTSHSTTRTAESGSMPYASVSQPTSSLRGGNSNFKNHERRQGHRHHG